MSQEIDQYVRSERNGILMLIAHLRDLLPEDTGAFKQLDSLHQMICQDAHRPYVEADQLEEQES